MKTPESFGIYRYYFLPDGSLVVDQDVDLSYKKLTKIPFKFKRVRGFFDCHGNGLTSLEGCPESVGGWFECSNNLLHSLEGGPKEVGKFYSCHCNCITSLKGAPEKVGKSFDCSDNKLSSLKEGPGFVGKHFFCKENKVEFTDDEVQYAKNPTSSVDFILGLGD